MSIFRGEEDVMSLVLFFQKCLVSVKSLRLHVISGVLNLSHTVGYVGV